MEIKRLVWDMLNLNFLPKKKCERKTSIRNCLRGSELHLRHGSTFGVYGEGRLGCLGEKDYQLVLIQ